MGIENGIEEGKIQEWVNQGNETTMIGYRIISLAEQTDILRQYTTLNDDFTKRLKDENRATDDENVNKKRFKNSPPAKKFQKCWRVEDKEQYWISKSRDFP